MTTPAQVIQKATEVQQMAVHTDGPRTVMKTLPRFEPVILDNTAIMLFKRCPRAYFYQMVLGFREAITQPYFSFGLSYHKFREVLDKTYLEYKDKMDKKELYEFCQFSARTLGLKRWTKDYPKDVPIGTKYDYLSANRLLASFEVAFEWWKNEMDSGNIEVISTEQFFCVQLPSGDPIGGRGDRLIKKNDRFWGQDYKSSSKDPKWYRYLLKPNHQFILYTWAESQIHGQRLRGQIIEQLFNDKKSGPKITPFPVEFTETQMEAWIKDVTYWIKQIRIAREEDHYPMNETTCNFCPFKKVCENYSEASMQATLKSAQDYRHEPWDCSKSSDD